MTDTQKSTELLPCPFCGTQPKLPDGDGTQYEIWCEDCGGAVAAVQICDLMTLEERASDSFKDYRYGEEFVERAKLEAIDRWNTRTQPAEQQDEPVGWQFLDNGQWHNGDDRIKDHRANTEAAGYRTRNVYARPAAQAVKLPERINEEGRRGRSWLSARRWNACIDAVARLNGIS